MFLKCGSVFRTGLFLTAKQLVEGSVIAGYGDCSTSKAVITGADDFSGGWTKSGQIWSRSVPIATPKIGRIFVQGEAVRLAQWPNADVSRNLRGFALTSSSATTAPAPANSALVVSESDRSSLAGKDLAGAAMQIRHGGAQVDANSVKSYDGATGAISFNSIATFNVPVNNGYLLQGKHWMLDAPGEFFHDQAAGMLHVWPTTAAAQANLNAVLVEGAVRDIAFQVSHVAKVAISNVAGVKTRRTGILVYNAAAAQLSGVEGSDNMRSGLQISTGGTVTGAAGNSVRSSVFLRNLIYGIDTTGPGNGLIAANTVADTGVVAFVGQSAAGILGGPGWLIENNVVRNSALTGIRFDSAGGGVVRNNLVVDSCMVFADCGGIYSWNGPKRIDSLTNQRSRVEGNTVVRAPINLEGSGAGSPNFNAGIYLDVFVGNCTIVDNTLIDMPIGVYLHNASHTVIEANKISLVSQAALWAHMDETEDYLVANMFRGNQIVLANSASGAFPAPPSFTKAQAIRVWHNLYGGNAVTSGANQFIGNDIVQLNDPSIPVSWIRGPAGDFQMSTTAWNGFNPGDVVARAPQLFALYAYTLGPAERIVNGGFDAGLGGWRSFFSTASATRGSVASGTTAGCVGKCALFEPQTVQDTLISPAFAMQASSLYRIAFQSSFMRAGSVSKPGFVRESGSGAVTTGVSSSSHLAGVAGQTIAYEGFFSATSSERSTVRLAASAGSGVGFDSVSIREVTGLSLSRQADWAAYAVAGAEAISVDCTALGWPAGCQVNDSDGRAVALPAVLTARSAKVFLRGDSEWRVR